MSAIYYQTGVAISIQFIVTCSYGESEQAAYEVGDSGDGDEANQEQAYEGEAYEGEDRGIRQVPQGHEQGEEGSIYMSVISIDCL